MRGARDEIQGHWTVRPGALVVIALNRLECTGEGDRPQVVLDQRIGAVEDACRLVKAAIASLVGGENGACRRAGYWGGSHRIAGVLVLVFVGPAVLMSARYAEEQVTVGTQVHTTKEGVFEAALRVAVRAVVPVAIPS